MHIVFEGIKHLRNPPEADTLVFQLYKIAIFSLTTCLDAFGVGISLGIAHKLIIPFITSIGIWAFISTLAGLFLAKKHLSKFIPIINFLEPLC